MGFRKIVFKTISKRKNRTAQANVEIKKLRKAGFKNASIIDDKIVGKGRKIRGVGTRVFAFKGRKATPKGFRSKKEEF